MLRCMFFVSKGAPLVALVGKQWVRSHIASVTWAGPFRMGLMHCLLNASSGLSLFSVRHAARPLPRQSVSGTVSTCSIIIWLLSNESHLELFAERYTNTFGKTSPYFPLGLWLILLCRSRSFTTTCSLLEQFLCVVYMALI